MPIDSDCINRLYCSFPLPSLIFIYSMIGLLICKYEPLWQDVNVQSLILRWPLRPIGLLYSIRLLWDLFYSWKKAICVSLCCYNKGITAQVSIVYVFPVDDNGYLIWESSWKSAGFKIINLIRYLFPARSSCHCGYASWWCFIYSYPVTIRERIANA